jgi:hypothetical protein
MTDRTVSINRAPVLTLWAAVVAERMGFDQDEALSLGRAVAGLNAQAKGRRLGVFKPHEQRPEAARKDRGGRFLVEVCGRPVPAAVTEGGVRAVRGGRAIDPGGVEAYLERAFGDDLKAARAAMRKLARAYPPPELAVAAYPLYERFRPDVPAGRAGWGVRGKLDLGLIEQLAKERQASRPRRGLLRVR